MNWDILAAFVGVVWATVEMLLLIYIALEVGRIRRDGRVK